MIRPLLILCLCATSSVAENLYVRAGASGNGTSWANAWGSFSSIAWNSNPSALGAVGAGDTLWIAGGNYNGPCNIRASGTAENRIYIKRATVAAHGSDDGWTNSFDATVYITCYPESTPQGFVAQGTNAGSYVTIDGVTPYAGFDLYLTHNNSMNGAWMGGLFIGGDTSVTGLIFKNAAIHADPNIAYCDNSSWFSGEPCDDCANGIWPTEPGCWHGITRTARGMVLGPSEGHQNRDITISSVDFYALTDGIWVGRNDGVVVEYCKLRDINSNGGSDHANNFYNSLEGASGPKNITFRYNEVSAGNTGVYIACMHYAVMANSGFYIYGNTFFDHRTYPGAITFDVKNVNVTDCLIYNNTFVNVECAYKVYYDGTVSGSFKNNILCGTGFGSGDPIPGGNNFTNTNPNIFVGTNVGDFHLVAPVGVGIALDSPFNQDADGVTRGKGVWDIGAYEFDDGATNPPVITPNNWTLTNSVYGRYQITAPTATWFGASNLPAGLVCTNSTGVIGGTPTETVTNDNVTLTCSNQYGLSMTNITVTVVPQVGVLSVSPSPLDFWYVATNCTADGVLVVSNAGSALLEGSATNITSPFTFPSNVVYSLAAHTATNIAVRFSPTSVGNYYGSVSWSSGDTNYVQGFAYPVATGTNWNMVNSLLRWGFTDSGDNYLVATNAYEANPNAATVFGFRLESPQSVRFVASVISTNTGEDSFYFVLNTNVFRETENVWCLLPVNTGSAFVPQFVHQWGNGTYNNPQYSNATFTVNAGVNYVVLGARESGAKVRDITVVGATNIPAPVVYPVSNIRVLTVR